MPLYRWLLTGGSTDCILYHVLFLPSRFFERLELKFAEIMPDQAEESQPSELADLKAEMAKNKKRIKSMMAMLEAQNKLLRTWQ